MRAPSSSRLNGAQSLATAWRDVQRRVKLAVFTMRDANHVERIRTILRDHARLNKDVATLDDNADLYQAGMTSHASVNVMLALEGEFEVEFPDQMLKRSVFESVAAIAAAIAELTK